MSALTLGAAATGAPQSEHQPQPEKTMLIWLLGVYLALEYARPPAIAQLRLQMLLMFALPLICMSTMPARAWTRILTVMVLFFSFNVVTVPFRSNYFAAYAVTRSLFGNIAIALAMTWIASDLKSLKKVLAIWLALMAYVAFHGVTHGGTGPGGFLGDENDLALACLTAMPFAYFGFDRLSGSRRLIFAGFGALLLAAIVASFSRGGFVGLVAVTGYFLASTKHKVRILAAMVVAGLLLFALAPSEYIDEVKSIQAEASGEKTGGTGESRAFLWTAALEMWKANPVLGIGGGNFNFLVGDFQPDWEGRDYEERKWTGTTTHSVFFQILAEQGTVGSALWVGVIVLHFVMLRRVRLRVRGDPEIPEETRNEIEFIALGLSGAMVGFMASGAFLSVAYYPYAYYFPALGVALDVASRRDRASAATSGQ